LLGDGKVTHLPGGIEEYLARRSGTAGSARPAAAARRGGSAQAGSGGASARRSGSAAPGGGPAGGTAPAPAGGPRPGAEQRSARKEASRLERRLETLAAREKALHEQMVDAATDPDRLLSLDGELRGVVAERESVELEWLEAAEAAE
jgi:ATP-binding cassette subfamily F protein uup